MRFKLRGNGMLKGYSVIRKTVRGRKVYELNYSKTGFTSVTLGLIKTMKEVREIVEKHRGERCLLNK